MDLGIDFSLIVYILAAVAVGLGGGYTLLKQDRVYSAAGLVIVSIAIFTYFGLRWFDGLRLKQSLLAGVPRTSQWPPQINYCPDFLSLKTKDNKYYCVDTTGVSPSMPLYTVNSDIDTQNPNYLELTKDKTAQQYVSSNFLAGVTSGLTWEGVYDGVSASNVTPPFPA